MKLSRLILLPFSLGATLAISACSFGPFHIVYRSSEESSSPQTSSLSSNVSSLSEEENSSELSSQSSQPSVSSESSTSSLSSSASELLPYEEKDNTLWPTSNKTYRVVPMKATGDSITVYNVKYDTHNYLAYPTTLTINKTDSCLTYETVALYYQAFREFPPNYTNDKSAVEKYTDYRYVSTYTKGSYSGSSDYTTALGTFRNSSGKYYELDIALSSSYYGYSRGAARLVIVKDGISEYSDSSPVCYYTKDHYADFVEFYNYADGWSEEFAGIYNSSGSYENTPEVDISRPEPETVTPTYL